MASLFNPPEQKINSAFEQSRTDDVRRLAKGAGVATFGRVGGRGLNFLIQVLLARLLGPEEFGLYVIGWTFIRMVSVIGPLGLDQGIIRFGTKYWQTDPKKFRELFYFSAIVSLLSGLTLGLILFLTAPLLAEVVFNKPGLQLVFRSFAFALPLVTSLRLVASATTISQSLRYATFSEELGQPLSELILVLGFYLLLNWKLEGAVIAGGVSFAFALGLAIFYLLKLFPELKTKAWFPLHYETALFVFSIPTALAGLFGSSIVWVDRLLVGLFLSEAETGIYTTVSLVSIIFATILSGIKVIISPMVAKLYHQKELGRVEELYRVSTKWGTYISLPLIFVILFASRELLTLSFGESYLAGQNALLILTLTQFINVGTGANDMLLVMTGHQKSWLTISFIMLALNILLNSILIPAYGLLGAAGGTALTVVTTFFLGLLQVKRLLGIWPYDRRFLKGLFASLITIGIMAGFSLINIPSPFIKIMGLASIATLAFGISLVLLGMDTEDHQLLQVIKQRLNK